MDNNCLWIYIHLPKTGGTTFNGHLMKHLVFDQEFIHFGPTGNRFRKKNNCADFAQRTPEARSSARVLAGHEAYYGLHELLPTKEARYITFIREPASRYVSAYNFKMSQIPEKKRTDFNKWYEGKERKNPISKFYLRKFGILKESEAPAAQELLEKFWFVGLTDQLNNDLPLLFDRIGVPTEWTNYRVAEAGQAQSTDLPHMKNLTPSKLISLNDEIRNMVATDHPHDAALFQKAIALAADFQKRLK